MKKNTLDLKKIFSILVLISCCDIAYINYIYNISKPLLFLRLFLIIIIYIHSIFKKKRFRLSKIFIIINMLFLLFFTVSLNRTTENIYYMLKLFSKPYLIILYIQLDILYSYKIKNTLSTWRKLLLILCVVDLITIIMYPGGMYKDSSYTLNWFLGYKSARLVYSWPLLFITTYLDFSNKKQKLSAITIFSYVISIYGTIASQATGASVSLIIYVILIYLLCVNKINANRSISKMYSLLNFKKIILYLIVTYYLIMSIEKKYYIQKIVVLFLKKSKTLSNRVSIWKNCINFFKSSPIIGKGIYTPTEYKTITKFYLGTSAHNYLLTILISGGIIAIILYLIMFKVSMERKNYLYTKREISLIIAIIAFLISGVASSVLAFSTFAFLPFILLEHEKQQNRKIERNKKDEEIINEK